MDFKIKYSEEQLADTMQNKSINIELVNKDFAGYQTLSDGDKKALQHLVNAAKMMNNVTLEQDNPYNLAAKKYLEENAENNSHIAVALEVFNSLNGVAGFNGVDEHPVEIFENITLLKGRNFYPQDLKVEEFHDILIKMLKSGKVKEVQNILRL